MPVAWSARWAGTITPLLLAVFMLLFARALLGGVLAEVEPPDRARWQRVIEKIYSSVGGYVAGLIGICSVSATLTTTFLAITGTPFFLPLGILCGVSSAVPYAGPLVSGVTVTLFAWVTGGPLRALERRPL